MGRGKGHGSLVNLYHTCKKLGHTIRPFFGNLEVKSIWRPQKRHAFLTDSLELYGTFFQNQTDLGVHVLNTFPTIFFLFYTGCFLDKQSFCLRKKNE